MSDLQKFNETFLRLYQEEKLSLDLVELFSVLVNRMLRPEMVRHTYPGHLSEAGLDACIKFYKTYDPAEGKTPFAFMACLVKNAFTHQLFWEKANHARLLHKPAD